MTVGAPPPRNGGIAQVTAPPASTAPQTDCVSLTTFSRMLVGRKCSKQPPWWRLPCRQSRARLLACRSTSDAEAVFRRRCGSIYLENLFQLMERVSKFGAPGGWSRGAVGVSNSGWNHRGRSAGGKRWVGSKRKTTGGGGGGQEEGRGVGVVQGDSVGNWCKVTALATPAYLT